MYPQGMHILVIDPETRRRQLSERVLADDGFTVTAVAEGLSAIRVAATRRFALAVVATDLPGTLDGAATLRQIRVRQPWLKALFTGDPARRPRHAGRERDDFIVTPFQGRELLGCVFELLQRDSGGQNTLRRDCGRAG